MNNSVNTFSAQKNLEDLINEQSLLIFDEENWVGKDLWKIAEVTYSYDTKTNLNTTLFVNGGGLDLELYKKSGKETRNKLLLAAKEKLVKLLNEKKSQINTALGEVELLDIFSQNEIEIDKKSIFINSLIEKKDFLNYCLISLVYELEKAGIDSGLSKEEELEIDFKIDELEKQLFGGKIKDNPEETILSYEIVYEKYLNNKKAFTKEEQKRFEGYLSKIKLPKGYKYKTKIKPTPISGDFLDLNIPKADYILGFNILVEALEKMEHIVESNDSAKSISDGPKGVQFPTTKEFDYIRIIRFFRLGNHEIETHNITDYNSKQLFGNLRGAKSTEKDEGVAMLMEQLFSYGKELYKIDSDGDQIIDIDKIGVKLNFTRTLMGELLSSEELLNFLLLCEKISPDSISPIDRFYRLKRNNKTGVQHKDTTYTRGLFKAIKEINKYIKSKGKKGINPEDLFLGKISFEETHKLKSIKEAKEKAGENIEILKPLFISDAVYFAISEKLKGNVGNINGDDFYKYLQEKYPIFNFTKEQIKEVSHKTKRNVYGIVNILLKNISEYQLNSITQTQQNINKKLLNLVSKQYTPKIEQVREYLHPSRKNAK